MLYFFYRTFAPLVLIMANSKNSGNKAIKSKSWDAGKNIISSILRWTYQSTMAVSTSIILILYLVSAYSDHVDPRSLYYLSFLGIGFQIILAIALCWLGILVILRHWKWSLILALGLILTHEQISRSFPVNISSEDSDSAIKVMTYNTCGLGLVQLSKIDEKIPVLDVIRQVNADVVCLQEYAFSLSKKGHTQDQIRKSLADIYPYYDYLQNSGRRDMGIALYSKYPITKKARIDNNEKSYSWSMYYELEINNRRIALVNTHMSSNKIKIRDRELYDEMIEHFAADSIQRIRTGMLRSLGKGYVARASEANMIKKFVLEQTRDEDIPIIICGDMNDTPISYCYRTMRGELEDAWQNTGFGRGSTYNQHHFWFRIDHIFHSSHFKTLRTEILDQYEYSDHYPVLSTLQLLPCN